ncbi:MAG: hypothetical protein GY856_08660, partial [bacterium]|nr:hypothetical protein [bacterium]
DRTGLPQTEWTINGGTGVVEGVPEGLWTVHAVAPDGRYFLGSVAAAGGREVEVVLE